MQFDIVTICTKKRKSLIEDYLKNISHITHYTEDYNLPENWRVKPCYQGLAIFMHQHIGHLRCCYGHRDALLKTTKDYILVLEDDAEPNREDWLDIVKKSIYLLDHFELVSLHGREFDLNKFNRFKYIESSYVDYNFFHKKGLNLLVPKDKISPRRILGSLAYLVRKDVIQRFIDFTYQGMGQDLFICNCFDFALVNPSPFDHNRSQGSLIDKNTFK